MSGFLKKIIKLRKDPGFHVLGVEYNPKTSLVTLGGNYRLSEHIWKLYIAAFGECDGEPNFYEVTRGKTRISFRSTFKNYQKALNFIEKAGYTSEDVTSFDRLM